MSLRPNHSNGNKAVSLLATCLVVLGGAVTCAVIVLSVDAERRQSSLQWTLGVMGGIIVLLWLFRDRPPENQAKAVWGWLGRKRRRRIAYRARAMLPASQRSGATPGPPTVESVRDIAAGTNTWVPASTCPPKRPETGPNS